MEKRRRARINESLSSLKLLVLGQVHRNVSYTTQKRFFEIKFPDNQLSKLILVFG